MAFDYTTANSGVFCRLGKIIKKINAALSLATTTYPADLKEIVDLYEAADLTAIIEGLYGTYEGFRGQVTGVRQALAGYADRTLLDRDTVLEQLRVPQASIQAVLAALIQQMVDDGKTVQKNTVTLGSATASASNTGTGVVLATKVLDGWNSPLQGAAPHIRYNGLASELAVPSETMVVECVADSIRDGTAEGAELFAWRGGIPDAELGYQDEGSGQGPTVACANGSRTVQDGDFENWSDNTPSNWTIAAGTAGTHVFREASNVFRGSSAAKLLGNGAQATISLEQSVPPSLLKSRRRYCLSLRVKASSVPASGQLGIRFAGTGYATTAPTNEVQDLQISGSPTGGTYTISWTGPYGGTQTTAPLAYNATSAQVQAALRLLKGMECVVVATQAGSPPDVTHRITLYGLPGPQNLVDADVSGLTGGSPAKSVTRVTAGVEGDCVVLPAAAFPTDWALPHFWINTPTILPADWKLVVEVTGTLTNAVAVYVDSLALEAVTYHGGVGLVVVAGQTRWISGDRTTFTVANDQAGKFQEFFRKRYKVQLPSSGSPNISDALAA
jgi:hypothetical protein